MWTSEYRGSKREPNHSILEEEQIGLGNSAHLALGIWEFPLVKKEKCPSVAERKVEKHKKLMEEEMEEILGKGQWC